MKILNIITKILEFICFALMLTMMIVTFAQVVRRVCFGSAFFWAEECTILAMVWSAFLGSAVAMGRGAHTRIDAAINLLPGKGKQIMDIIDYIVVGVFVVLLGNYSLPIIETTGRMLTTGMKIPRSILYYSVLFGSVLIAIYCVVLAIKAIIDFKKPQEEN